MGVDLRALLVATVVEAYGTEELGPYAPSMRDMPALASLAVLDATYATSVHAAVPHVPDHPCTARPKFYVVEEEAS